MLSAAPLDSCKGTMLQVQPARPRRANVECVKGHCPWVVQVDK